MTSAPDTRPDYEIAADQLAALLEREGLTVSAVFVPFSRSRNAKPGRDGKVWRSLNWRVTVNRQGRDANTGAPAGPVHVIIADVDYSQGEAHAPSYKASAATIARAARVMHLSPKAAKESLIAHEVETGHKAQGSSAFGLSKGQPIPAPSAVDVLSSLLMDAGAIDFASFDDWASEYGYDADSRSAEGTYRACLAHALALRSALGDAVLTEARDLAHQI